MTDTEVVKNRKSNGLVIDFNESISYFYSIFYLTPYLS